MKRSFPSKPLPFLAAFLAVAAACKSAPEFQRAGSDSVVALNVITVPVGLNLDGIPGPDGFSAKIYANNELRAKGIPMRDGSLELLMFDGSLVGLTKVPEPLKTWRFTAEQLPAYEFTASLGTGYEFVLLWETNRPAQRLISVAARYTSRDGSVVTSRPSSVTVINR